MSDHPLTPKLLPAPLRRYWSASKSRSSRLSDWDLRLVTAGDSSTPRTVVTRDRLWTPTPTDLEPPAGAILVATPPPTDSLQSLADVAWLRSSFPWLSLAVTIPDSPDDTLHDAVAAAMAQAGAIVFNHGSSSHREIAAVVDTAFVPKLAIPIWLSQALPGWEPARRDAAVALLLDGLGVAAVHREGGGIGPSHAPLWLLVGRALGVARALQRAADGDSLDQIAVRSAYSAHRASDRALRRYFGLPAREVRGTIGWEWLLWRFLSGLGDGKHRFWDQ